jgi:membrane-bound ClpP family serine protease
MLIFVAIAIGSFILVAGSFLFGHDHDAGDHAADHQMEGHDLGHDAEPTISVFSIKVLGTLTMGFGAAGALARHYGSDYLISSIWGVGTGLGLSCFMYLILKLIYSQQASSLVQTSSAVGLQGTVTTSIGANTLGEVEISVGGQRMVYLARSADAREIPKGKTVQVTQTAAGELFVKESYQ